MNFEFSEDVLALRDQARRLLRERSSLRLARQALEGDAADAAGLWREIARLGWLGAAVPEEYGGAGLGYEALCVIAEELGRELAPVPFSSSVVLATEALLLMGSEAQKQTWLPRLADGSVIGTLALAEGPGRIGRAMIAADFAAGELRGSKWPVPDAAEAGIAIVIARDAAGRILPCLVELASPGVTRQPLETVDGSRGQARVVFDGVTAEPLGSVEDGWEKVLSLLDRAAILTAFEQIGGASACLQMATDFARERHAFGRPIGSYQAIKHKLADIFIANELARSNAYFGALTLSSSTGDLPLAAAAARISAIDAYALASRENIQTHGGMGFTWEADCHLFYRRAKLLALGLGSAPYWKERLVARLERRNLG